MTTPGPRLAIETGTAFELIASTLMVADPAGRHQFTELDLWLRLAHELAPRDRRTFAAMGQHVMINLLGLASESPGGRSAADLLAHVGSLSPTEVVLHAVGRYRRTVVRATPGDVIDDAVAGDANARKRFLGMSWPDVPDWQKSLQFLLGRPPEAVGPDIVDALQHWHDRVYAVEAARLGQAQEEQAAIVRAESRAWRIDSLIRRVAPGTEYVPPVGVELMAFVPVSSIRPVVIFLDHRMDTLVLFSIAEAAPAGDGPPERLVLLGKAIGDELRLRTLRALAPGPRTLADLATEFGVPRTSLAHHVAILRAAGLLTHTIDDGRWGKLRLNPEAIAEVAPLFRDFVGPSVATRPGSRRGGA